MRKGSLLAALAAGLLAGVVDRCVAGEGETPLSLHANGGCPACMYPPWSYMPGGPCLHIGWYGCAPPSNYHPITWSTSPEDSARMVRERLAGMMIAPPVAVTPAPPPAREVAPATTPDDKAKELPKPMEKKLDTPKLEELPTPLEKKTESSRKDEMQLPKVDKDVE